MSKAQRSRIVPYYGGHFLIYFGFLIVTLVAIWLTIQAYRINNSYQAVRQQLSLIEAAMPGEQPLPGSDSGGFYSEAVDLAQLELNLREIDKELQAIDEASAPFLPLIPYLGWLPGYGETLQALPDLLDLSRELTGVGVMLADTLQPILSPGTAEPILPYVVARLSRISAELKPIEIRLRQHQANVNEIHGEQLTPEVGRRVGQLKQYLPQAIAAVHELQVLPQFLGSERPQTYLILTQNADELRPSGGYINAAGHITFDQGQIAAFVMQDSYAIDRLSDDYPYPPDPLYNYMAADYWVLRDASWSPDFPTTARTAIDLYELGQGVSADGVIALDQYGISHLLQALGAVDVDGEQVTSANVIQLMRQHWAPVPGQKLDGAWWGQRKSFMLTLAETLRHKFDHEFDTTDIPALIRVLQQSSAEKHMLLYLKDDSLLVENLTGALQPTTGDYLMVVDANVGFNKVNAVVERNLNYQIMLNADGSGQAQAQLIYQHQARRRLENCSQEPRYNPLYEQNMARCYWNYLTLIVPAKAHLISGPQEIVEGQYLLRGQSTTGEIDVVPLSSDKVSWGQLFLLAPEEHITLEFAYALPPNTARFLENQWEYDLYLQKQPGTLAPMAEVIVTLPAGGRVVDSQPLPSSLQQEIITYQLDLKTDREIKLLYNLP